MLGLGFFGLSCGYVRGQGTPRPNLARVRMRERKSRKTRHIRGVSDYAGEIEWYMDLDC